MFNQAEIGKCLSAIENLKFHFKRAFVLAVEEFENEFIEDKSVDSDEGLSNFEFQIDFKYFVTDHHIGIYLYDTELNPANDKYEDDLGYLGVCSMEVNFDSQKPNERPKISFEMCHFLQYFNYGQDYYNNNDFRTILKQKLDCGFFERLHPEFTYFYNIRDYVGVK